VDALLDVFVRDPWMLWATVGTALIVVVVVTSIRYARARMRYESWHLLHLYAYLGMAFRVATPDRDGADFHGIVAQVYWWGLYAFPPDRHDRVPHLVPVTAACITSFGWSASARRGRAWSR